tara:strand:- start:92 stop:352 length:261 start_codon:yes stop_codon:yes gene_type:complete
MNIVANYPSPRMGMEQAWGSRGHSGIATEPWELSIAAKEEILGTSSGNTEASGRNSSVSEKDLLRFKKPLVVGLKFSRLFKPFGVA